MAMGSHGKKRSKMISLRITEEQLRYLDDMAERIRQQSGFRVTRSSIILKLMEYGVPMLNKEFPPMKKLNQEDNDPKAS